MIWFIYNAKILDKPRTEVRGESWTSKPQESSKVGFLTALKVLWTLMNPDKLRTSVRSKT